MRRWSSIKNLIGNAGRQEELFLSLIEEDGTITCANATMVKNLEIGNPRSVQANFLELVHPIHRDQFKKTIQQATTGCPSQNVELYIKNGSYHPMSWQVNHLNDVAGAKKTYLCMGYKILDDKRTHHFNELLNNNISLIIEGLTAILFHDKMGNLITANQKAASLFNTTLERLYQIDNAAELWNNHWHITDTCGQRVSFDEAPFRKVLQTKQVEKKTLYIQLANGEKCWLLFTSQLLPGVKNALEPAVISTITDVSPEHQLSNRLKENEAFISAFFQKTPSLAWVLDSDENLLFASGTFFRHFKINEKDSLHKKITDILPAAVTNPLYQKHIDVFETGQPVETTEQIKWADGSRFIAHVTIFPIQDGATRKLVAGQALLLPDKTQLEKELHDTRQRLLTLNRATSDAIWEWDMQTGQIFRNEVLMEMIGFQPDNSKGLSWWLRRIHPEDRNQVADTVKEATDSMKQSWQGEYRFKFADGKYKAIRDKGFVVYENGLPIKMIGSLQDVSAFKEMENELADEKLKWQKEVSETVIRVQEKERARIGYELHDNVNQILSTTKLFVDMFKAGNKEQEQIKEKSAAYLALAIEEIRKLSKELSVPQLRKENLIDSIHNLLQDIQLAGAMQFSFTHDPSADLLSSGKKVTLFRIIQEQLKNIIKHSNASTTQVVLSGKNEYVELIVKDNGTGFDPQKSHSGIGLSNIYERTKFYNGTVNLQTAPGKGCTLTITLPVKD